jgi:hypothetical protein
MVFLFELYEKYTADLFSKAKPKKNQKIQLKKLYNFNPIKNKKKRRNNNFFA